MLASNFVSAKELHIEEEHRQILIRLLGMLERDELHHVPHWNDFSSFSGDIRNGFNMGVWDLQEQFTRSECGTVCCLGGWAERMGWTDLREGRGDICENYAEELYDLFHPPERDPIVQWEDITPMMAAEALRNYLTTGESRWETIRLSK